LGTAGWDRCPDRSWESKEGSVEAEPFDPPPLVMAVHRDALSGQVARTARAGPRARLHLRCGVLGGWWTRIVAQALEMRPKGAHRLGGESVSPTSDLGGPAGGASAIGGAEFGPHSTAPGIPDRGAIVLGPQPPLDRPGARDRHQATARPSCCLGTNWTAFREDASAPGTSKDASGMREGLERRKGGLTDWKVSPPDGWIAAEMTSAAGLVAGGERRWRGGGAKARAKTAQEPMMCRLTCANVAERAQIYGILSRELPPLCAPRTRLFRHRRAVAL
jgi:hypothetical protein